MNLTVAWGLDIKNESILILSDVALIFKLTCCFDLFVLVLVFG